MQSYRLSKGLGPADSVKFTDPKVKGKGFEARNGAASRGCHDLKEKDARNATMV